MMTKCGMCGLGMLPDEIHDHIPDFFLNVQNMQYVLSRSIYKDDGNIEIQGLDFNIPDHWAQWVLDSCGGAMDRSGRYHLPGLVWEWVIGMTSGDKRRSDLLADRIEGHLSYHIA
jgi:hypothetical protein